MRRQIALLLTAASMVSLCAMPAQASSGRTGIHGGKTQEQIQEESAAAEAAKSVSWAELESRIRAGSLSAQILAENISGIEGIDYDLMQEDLRRQLNDLANAQWYITLMGGDDSSLATAYDTLRDTFDDLKDGEVQADNADVVWQLNDTVNQVVSAGETLYITLVGLEQSAADGQRGLETLDRSLAEMKLRQQLGQVSRQQVEQLEQTRTATVSQLSTLDNTITTYKAQLQNLIGETPTGTIELGALPTQGEDGWTAPDYDKDLAAAKAASWTLRSAEKTLEDAKEDWKDAQSDYRGSRKQYLLQAAEHTWNAAQITQQSTVQSFETSFKTLYDSLADKEQIWQSKQAALTLQQSLLATAEKKYDRGLISRNALTTAQEELADAQSAADTAWRDLFTARNSYRWAVEYGLLQTNA